MSPEIRWIFEVDDEGRAVPPQPGFAVETIEPGEYLVTLPLAVADEFGVRASVGDDAGFIAAVPGDECGRKPNTIRVLTVRPDNSFGPRDFTIVVSMHWPG
ncbi:MAG TPA: hypothetical protein VEZ11_12815 [Thermoanaerobaculia bacterium]|nr:hypothetical protein [Thermoanaerobaculia bacterium]